MNDLRNLRINLMRDGDSWMASFRADTGVAEGEDGLSSIWFVMRRREWVEAVSGGWVSFQDGYHRLDVVGHRWTFYDMPFDVAGRTGAMRVRFARVQVPQFVAKVLLRYFDALHARARQEATRESEPGSTARERWERGERWEYAIKISPERAARWCKLYGPGTGAAAVIFRDPETPRRLFADCADNEECARMFAHLIQIGQNATSRFWEEGQVVIQRDGPRDYYWVARRPSGSKIVNGGLNCHGGDDAPRWSLNT